MDGASLRILHQTLLGEALMSGSSAVFVSDELGRYLAVNDAGVELVGYGREELATMNTREVTVRSDDELNEVIAMLKRQHTIEQVARVRRKDGVVGTIGYVVVESAIAGMPVFVSVTAPIDTFAPTAD